MADTPSRPTEMTLAQARDALAGGQISSKELTDAHVSAVESARQLKAYITETPEHAARMAEAADARRAKGEARGPLDGVPIAIKDLFCTKDVLTSAGSHILDGFKPPYESTVTAKLWDAGAVMLGKTNLDEFAMGSSNETSYYGAAENPWRREGDNRPLVPGGSSGGSASAVAARAALGATGTDTGGSIRQPAALTGITGLKPTYGRCSRFGIVAFASSLDQAGPMARSVRDCAILLGGMAGYDDNDGTSVDTPVPDYEAALTGDIRGLKVGIPKEYRVDGMPQEIETLWQQGLTGCARRARNRSRSRCRARTTPCRPITSSRPRRRRPTWPATTACASACARTRAARSTRCTRRPARPASATRSSDGS